MAKSPKKSSAKPSKKAKAKDAQAQSEPCVLIIPEWTGQVHVAGLGNITVTIPAREVTLPACCCGEVASCCATCDGIPTGVWGIPWRDAAGNWQCLEHPGGDKKLMGDDNGPYWANP